MLESAGNKQQRGCGGVRVVVVVVVVVRMR